MADEPLEPGSQDDETAAETAGASEDSTPESDDAGVATVSEATTGEDTEAATSEVTDVKVPEFTAH